jgi:hypothetical protein
MCIVLIPLLQGASQKRLEDEESDSLSQSDLSQDEDGSELGSGSESDDLMRIDAKALERVFADEVREHCSQYDSPLTIVGCLASRNP